MLSVALQKSKSKCIYLFYITQFYSKQRLRRQAINISGFSYYFSS